MSVNRAGRTAAIIRERLLIYAMKNSVDHRRNVVICQGGLLAIAMKKGILLRRNVVICVMKGPLNARRTAANL